MKILCRYCDNSNKFGNCEYKIPYEPNCRLFSIDDSGAYDLINQFQKTFKTPVNDDSLLTLLLNRVNEAISLMDDVEIKLVDKENLEDLEEQLDDEITTDVPKECMSVCNYQDKYYDDLSELSNNDWLVGELNTLTTNEIANVLFELPYIKFIELLHSLNDKMCDMNR